MIPPFRTSAPDAWNQPRPHTDATQRFQKYGPVRPMDEPIWPAVRMLAGQFCLVALVVIAAWGAVVAFS